MSKIDGFENIIASMITAMVSAGSKDDIVAMGLHNFKEFQRWICLPQRVWTVHCCLECQNLLDVFFMIVDGV